MPRIVVSYFRVPGPAPQFDWTAFYDGTEETGPYGSGATPQAAINDLVDNYEADFGGLVGAAELVS